MPHESWWTIKVVLGGLAGAFALLAGVFVLLDDIYEDRHGRVKASFQAKWEAVGRSRWFNMPERVIRYFAVRVSQYAARAPVAMVERPSARRLAVIICAGSAGVGCIIALGTTRGIVPANSAVTVCVVWGVLVLAKILKLIADRKPKFIRLRKKPLDRLIDLCIPACAVLFLALLTSAILRFPPIYAVPAMVIFAPIYWLYAWRLLSWVVCLARRTDELEKRQDDFLVVFCAGMSLSFAVTLAAILIGHIASPGAWIPKTPQMLISNVVFDGLTLVATFFILGRALAHPTHGRIVVAVIVDLLVAAMLACLSLYLGLVLTSKALSLGQTLNVLVGLSPGGARAEAGPYFWAMHTTFLPTLAYLGLIAVACMGKALLIPVRWFLGVGHESKIPLKVTAALFGVLVALFLVSAYAAGVAEAKARKTPAIHKVPGRAAPAAAPSAVNSSGSGQ